MNRRCTIPHSYLELLLHSNRFVSYFRDRFSSTININVIIVLIALHSISLSSIGQKIRDSKFDKFTKKYKIETTAVTIDMQLSSVLTVSVRSHDTAIFIKFSGRGYSVGVVGAQDVAIILLSNDSTIELKSKGLQTYELNGGVNGTDRVFYYEYHARLNDIYKLSTSEIASIRIFSNQHYSDIDIKPKKSELVNKLCQLFINEYKEKIEH